MHVLALRMTEFLTIYLFISGQLIIGADAQDIYQHLSHYGNRKIESLFAALIEDFMPHKIC